MFTDTGEQGPNTNGRGPRPILSVGAVHVWAESFFKTTAYRTSCPGTNARRATLTVSVTSEEGQFR